VQAWVRFRRGRQNGIATLGLLVLLLFSSGLWSVVIKLGAAFPSYNRFISLLYEAPTEPLFPHLPKQVGVLNSAEQIKTPTSITDHSLVIGMKSAMKVVGFGFVSRPNREINLRSVGPLLSEQTVYVIRQRSDAAEGVLESDYDTGSLPVIGKVVVSNSILFCGVNTDMWTKVRRLRVHESLDALLGSLISFAGKTQSHNQQNSPNKGNSDSDISCSDLRFGSISHPFLGIKVLFLVLCGFLCACLCVFGFWGPFYYPDRKRTWYITLRNIFCTVVGFLGGSLFMAGLPSGTWASSWGCAFSAKCMLSKSVAIARYFINKPNAIAFSGERSESVATRVRWRSHADDVPRRGQELQTEATRAPLY